MSKIDVRSLGKNYFNTKHINFITNNHNTYLVLNYWKFYFW